MTYAEFIAITREQEARDRARFRGWEPPVPEFEDLPGDLGGWLIPPDQMFADQVLVALGIPPHLLGSQPQ
jgi:hypothetical protein